MSLFRFIFLAGAMLTGLSVHAESTRIHVYALAENYYDTQAGDTLSGITQHLLPNNPSLQKMLAGDILQLNPKAFTDNNPAALRANIRLSLPVYMPKADTQPDPENTSVESFAWGNIKRPQHN